MTMTTSDEPFASYWQATTTRLPLSTDVPPHADVVIVGGGILGAATCYWLAKSGMAPLLLERTMPAYGATGRNGGFVSVGPAGSYAEAEARLGPGTAQSVLRVTRENQILLQHFLGEEEIDCEYRKPGSIHLALDEEQWRKLTQETNVLQTHQLQTVMLDRRHLQDMITTPLSEEITGGRFFPEDAVIHPIKLVEGLLEASRRYGARISRATVVRLKPAQEATSIYTTTGSLSAGKVLVATNAWIGELLPSLARLITPVRGQMLSYAPIPSAFPVAMSSSLSSTDEYWHQRTDGALLLGGCRAAAPNADEGIAQSIPSQEVQMALEHVFPRLFPQLRNLQVQHRWAGLMAFTPDFLPIADQAPDLPGVWAVGGFSGHGMPFGMRLSQLLAEAITTGKPPADLGPFRLDRPTLRFGLTQPQQPETPS